MCRSSDGHENRWDEVSVEDTEASFGDEEGTAEMDLGLKARIPYDELNQWLALPARHGVPQGKPLCPWSL